MQYLKTVAILFILGMIAITTINSVKGKPPVDEGQLRTTANNLSQIVAAESTDDTIGIPATVDDFNDLLNRHLELKLSATYIFDGEAQEPGMIGFKPIKNDVTVVGWTITAMGNQHKLIYWRSVDS